MRVERVDHGSAEVGRKGVQLDDVGPGGKVRVAAVGQHAVTDPDEGGRIPFEVFVAPGDEVLRVRRRPGMVGRNVIRHEVEDQLQATLRQLPAGRSEPLRTAELGRDLVVADAVRRTDHVRGCEIRQCAFEALHERIVSQRDLDPGRAALPDAHQPDRVKTERRDRVPLLPWHFAETELRASGGPNSASQTHVSIS